MSKANVVHINAQGGSYLGTVHFCRHPDGSIGAMITDMAAWQIEAEPTIEDRFRKFAEWLRAGADDLDRQGAEFRSDSDGR